MNMDCGRLKELAKELYREERSIKRLDGWFLVNESHMKHEGETVRLSKEARAAYLPLRAVEELPLSIGESSVFAGTQRDSFAATYALINPAFRVETFAGYCDPTEVFDGIAPNDAFPPERIERVRKYVRESEYVTRLSEVYKAHETSTAEVAFFMEQVTGHVVPDLRALIAAGVHDVQAQLDAKIHAEQDPEKADALQAMRDALEATNILAGRYRALALAEADAEAGRGNTERALRLTAMADMLSRMPHKGARTMAEAIQSFILIWQVMCLEQAPNPFAFSVGNADRIFEPYRAADGLSRDEASALLSHLLAFFNVGERSWAISQNLIAGGRSAAGEDLTSVTTYALLDAYYDMNFPQPILSVKLHACTPERIYREMGRFFFTPGCLTPSLLNDDSVIPMLLRDGVSPEDAEMYGVAGCQEPLVMGKDSGNTTNSWLNLAKVLELTLNGGVSTLTGRRIIEIPQPATAVEMLSSVKERFYEILDRFLEEMEAAANGAIEALSCLRVPFLSVLMGGADSGIDLRDTSGQGMKYNGSGCLIHGLAVVADSFVSIDCLLRERPEDAQALLDAIKCDFVGFEPLREYLRACPKYGANEEAPDREAAELASRVSDMVSQLKTYGATHSVLIFQHLPRICCTAIGWERCPMAARRGTC